MHCKRVHGLVAQMKLFDNAPEDLMKEKADGKKLSKAAKKLKPVRDSKLREIRTHCGEPIIDDGPTN